MVLSPCAPRSRRAARVGTDLVAIPKITVLTGREPWIGQWMPGDDLRIGDTVTNHARAGY